MGKSKYSSVALVDFEQALTELNQLVEHMEQGGLTLAASLKSFERGMHLVQACQTSLQTAQQKVQVLLEQNGQASLRDFAKAIDES